MTPFVLWGIMAPRIQLVARNQIDTIWEFAEPVLALSQRRVARDVGTDDIYAALHAGHNQIWAVFDEDTLRAVIVTEVCQHPRSRILNILHLAGHGMAAWMEEALDTMTRFAKDMRCDVISAEGRTGWARYAPKHGFKEARRVYEMELRDGQR